MLANIVAWIATALAFAGLDAVWLSQMGPRLYRPIIGDLMSARFDAPSAIAFYLIYVTGIVFFAVLPGIEKASLAKAAINGAALGFIAYATGTPRFADYLLLTPTPGTAELAVVMGALVGGGLGFLWYNAPPAKVFMGDTGSLFLGFVLAALGIKLRFPGSPAVRSERAKAWLDARLLDILAQVRRDPQTGTLLGRWRRPWTR